MIKMVRKEKNIDEELKDLKTMIQKGKVVVGMDRVMKELKIGHLSKILIASNCRMDVKEDITHYAGLSSVEIIELNFDNEELGVFCKKNFLVSVLGVVGE